MQRKNPVSMIVTLLLLGTFFAALATPAHAHRMIIRDVEPGLLKVVYDDGSAAKRAQVTFYDGKDQELWTATVDDEGFLSYHAQMPIAKVVADDGLGHRTTWNYGTEEEELPLLPKAVLTVAVLLFVAAFFHHRSKKNPA